MRIIAAIPERLGQGLPNTITIDILPSSLYHDGMTSPQLSVRSARARSLAHQLSQREKRPIHAIVEDALEQYAARYPQQSAATFLKRLKALAVSDIELDGLIAENRKAHNGIEL